MNQPFFYTRKLPHWQPKEETFFITYRLAGSLPTHIIAELKDNYFKEKLKPENQSEERKHLIRQEYFILFDNHFEKNLNEPHWLKDNGLAKTVMDSLLFNDKTQYTLWTACIMSNHVHILISTFEDSLLLNKILQNHKKFTAVQCNKLLNRTGKFWAEESFDTIIRDNAHFWNTVQYIINNPVKAGLISRWDDWKWIYLHPEPEKEFRTTELRSVERDDDIPFHLK